MRSTTVSLASGVLILALGCASGDMSYDILDADTSTDVRAPNDGPMGSQDFTEAVRDFLSLQ